MTNHQFHTAISTPRFNRFLLACRNHRSQAEKLYRVNLRLSQKMYAVLGVFEVALRNSIDRHYTSLKGPTWLEEAVMPHGYIEATPGCEGSFHTIQEAIHKLGVDYTHDRLIAKLTLGFWVYQFSKKDFAAAGSTLLQIFPGRPHGTHQKVIFTNLTRINETRNRIAHYEPICFDKITGVISPIAIKRRYDLIIEMLYWLGYNPERILYGIDGVPKMIDEVIDACVLPYPQL